MSTTGREIIPPRTSIVHAQHPLARRHPLPCTDRRPVFREPDGAARSRPAVPAGLDRGVDPAHFADHGHHLRRRSGHPVARAMNGALPFIAAAALLGLALGFLARRGREMSLEQWTVGGGGFGAIFVFVLLAGEIYTA